MAEVSSTSRDSVDSGLGSTPPDRNGTIEEVARSLSNNYSLDPFFFSNPPRSVRDVVLRKLDASTLNKLRRVCPQISKEISTGRRRYPVRQPIYQLELTEEKIVYLTGRKTRKTVPFQLDEANKYELLKVQPEYITVYGHIFGSETSRLMKQDSPKDASDEWKDLCRFVMSQLGLHLDSDRNVLDHSEIPKYASRIDFGANQLPVGLIQKYLKDWRKEKSCQRKLSSLEVSFKEKLRDKEETAEELLSGMKFEKIWAPSSHEEGLFCDALLCDYEERLLEKYSLSLQDDPVLMYTALSNDGENMAVLAISDHAVKLNFSEVKNNGSYMELREMFMEITESRDYDAVSEWGLDRLLKRLRKVVTCTLS